MSWGGGAMEHPIVVKGGPAHTSSLSSLPSSPSRITHGSQKASRCRQQGRRRSSQRRMWGSLTSVLGGAAALPCPIGMENMAGNDIAEQEGNAGSIESPLFSGSKRDKRLRSKVWDYFTPTFVEGKLERAECMHCHRIFSIRSSRTSNLLRLQATCIPRDQKRPRMQEHTSLPCIQRVMVAPGDDPKQKKLPFLPLEGKKCSGTEDVTPVQEPALPDTPTNMNKKNLEVDQDGSHEELAAPEQKDLALPGISTDNDRRDQSQVEITSSEQKNITSDINQQHQEVDQDGSHEELAAPEQKDLALPGISTDNDRRDQSHVEITSSEQNISSGISQQHQEVEQDGSHEEFIRILAMHGHLPRMVEQDGFRKLVAWLNPIIKMPSHDDVMVNASSLFQKEKSKLKEELTALHSHVCLSVYMWHYDPVLPFLCLRVHYIDDEWEKQQKIIIFRAVDSSCSAKELSDIILGAVEEWGLDGKIFSIILDDAFIDDSVASYVKANLQERNPLAANRSLFVVRCATHFLDQVIQVGMDELDKILEKVAKCSKYTKSLAPAAVQYPNCRYAPSSIDWWTAREICGRLGDLHGHVDMIQRYPTPAQFFKTVWSVREDVRFRSYICKDDGAFSNMQKEMQKFNERWKVCFFYFCMLMVMDPECHLERMKSLISFFDWDKSIEEYFRDVHDTLASLFNEYSDDVEDPNNTCGSKTSKGTAVDGDKLVEYYRYHKYQYSERPMTELDQYVQDPHLTDEPIGLEEIQGDPNVLQWWKEHSLNYPTIARMARDVLALPCVTDWKAATRTAALAIPESDSKQWVEQLVCTQDWLTLAGASKEFDDDL